MTALDWKSLAVVLAATLEADGALPSPAWRRAFTATPRHLFVPCFLEQVNSVEQVIDGADPAQRDHWLEQVYSDTNLVTQIKASDTAGRGGRRPTSSSSMPSVMAWMLEALDLADGQRVLEIGTVLATTPRYCAIVSAMRTSRASTSTRRWSNRRASTSRA